MPEAAPSPPWQTEGRDLSRVLALSDGIFAFAMTLLVLGLILPPGFNPSQINTVLWGLRPAFLSYLLSFFVIWFYWRAHHLTFRYVTSYDRRLLNLNVVFLLFIAVMPFVTNLLSTAGSEPQAVWAYATVQVGAGGALTAVWWYASKAHRHVDPALPATWIRYLTRGTVTTPIVFLASMPIALWSPAACEYSWVGLLTILALVRRVRPAGGTS